jgi:hypothetical protein
LVVIGFDLELRGIENGGKPPIKVAGWWAVCIRDAMDRVEESNDLFFMNFSASVADHLAVERSSLGFMFRD